MKKFIALIMSALLLSLAGCKGDQKDVPSDPETTEPLRVFIDVEFGSSVFSSAATAMKEYKKLPSKGSTVTYASFQDVITELGGPEDIQLEFPPKSGEDRDAYMTALRTEIMAGKGPDLFVCLSGLGWCWDQADHTGQFVNALFQFPQQAMERSMFLPLDGYIEKAQFMEWDKLTPIIMEAGRTDKGQLLLPMTYTMPVAYFKEEDVEFRLDTGLTWKDMLSGPPELAAAAGSSHMSLQSAALWPMADYKGDKLTVTEEELLEYVTLRREAEERLKTVDVPDCTTQSLKPAIWFDDDYGKDNELTLIPVYSRSGGYTAVATSFLGININTRRPDDAFFVADYLMSKEAQQSKLYAYMTWYNALPTMEGLMAGRGWGVSDSRDGAVYMSENLYEKFVELREGISGTEFQTSLEKELYDLYSEAAYGESGKTVETLVHEAYMRMNMMLAES